MEEVSCAIQKGINELFVNGPVPEELTIKADAILPSQSIPSNCLCNCLRTYYGATNCFNTICVGATGNWCCQWDPNTTCCAKVNNKVVCAYGYECVASSYCCCFIEFTDGTRHCWNCGVETLNAGEWLIPGAIAETKLHLATSDSAYYTSNGGVNNVVCHVCNAGNLIRNPSTNSNFGTGHFTPNGICSAQTCTVCNNLGTFCISNFCMIGSCIYPYPWQFYNSATSTPPMIFTSVWSLIPTVAGCSTYVNFGCGLHLHICSPAHGNFDYVFGNTDTGWCANGQSSVGFQVTSVVTNRCYNYSFNTFTYFQVPNVQVSNACGYTLRVSTSVI